MSAPAMMVGNAYANKTGVLVSQIITLFKELETMGISQNNSTYGHLKGSLGFIERLTILRGYIHPSDYSNC